MVSTDTHCVEVAVPGGYAPDVLQDLTRRALELLLAAQLEPESPEATQ